jgi:hypothetical protein
MKKHHAASGDMPTGPASLAEHMRIEMTKVDSLGDSLSAAESDSSDSAQLRLRAAAAAAARGCFRCCFGPSLSLSPPAAAAAARSSSSLSDAAFFARGFAAGFGWGFVAAGFLFQTSQVEHSTAQRGITQQQSM